MTVLSCLFRGTQLWLNI